MKSQFSDFKTIIKALIFFFLPLAVIFISPRFPLFQIQIHSYFFHWLVMIIASSLAFYIFYRAYSSYKITKNPPLLAISLAFLTFGISLIFHAVTIPGFPYFFNETIFDIAEHYGLFIGSLILLGVVFPYNKTIENFFYAHHKILLRGLPAFFVIFFLSVIALPPLAEFLGSHINLPTGITGVAFFLNAIFIFFAHNYKKERGSLSVFLVISFLVLTSVGVIPFFYEEWNILWWFFHLIFIVGFLLMLLGLIKHRSAADFNEVFSHVPISARIILNYFIIFALGIFTLSYLNYYSAKANISEQLFRDLSLTSKVERENVLNSLEYMKGRTIDFSSDGFIRDTSQKIVNGEMTEENTERLNAHLIKNKMSLDKDIIGINIINFEGVIIASNAEGEIGENESNDEYFLRAKDLSYGDAYISNVTSDPHFISGKISFAASTVITDKETREPIGVIVNYYDVSVLNEIVKGRHGEINKIVDDTNDTTKTMEIFLANSDGLMITESKFVSDAVLRQRVYTEAYWQCQKGESIRGVYPDYRGVMVVGASECLPNGWVLVTKIDADEAFGLLKDIQKQSLISGIILLSFISLIAFSLSKAITLPLKKLEEASVKVISGDLSVQAEIVSNDEIGDLALIFNNMISQLRSLYEGLEQKVKERTKELAEKVEEVGREREKLSTILFGIGDGILVVDNDSNIVVWNKVAEKISGFSAKEVIGKKYDSILKLTNEKTGEAIQDFISATIKTGETQLMPNYTLLVKKDGSQVAVADSSAPLKDKNGNVVGCVVIFRDTTKEREIDKAKTEFVSPASHQLRTPLSAIRWYAEMLLNGDAGKLNKDQKEYMTSIDQSNLRMIDLVNALLNVSRIDMGTFAIDPKPTNFAEVAESVMGELVMQIDEKKIKSTKKYSKDLPLVEADPKLARIIMQNLLSNAVKYTPTGGKVSIAISKEKENILIKISDTGYGIPVEAQNNIFKKLFRADNVRAKEVDGTGLGLYVVKSIVDQSGGKIWFESAENKGTF